MTEKRAAAVAGAEAAATAAARVVGAGEKAKTNTELDDLHQRHAELEFEQLLESVEDDDELLADENYGREYAEYSSLKEVKKWVAKSKQRR
jgi:hypothetical protein